MTPSVGNNFVYMVGFQILVFLVVNDLKRINKFFLLILTLNNNINNINAFCSKLLCILMYDKITNKILT